MLCRIKKQYWILERMILIHPWHHYKKKDKDPLFRKLMKVYGYDKILNAAPPLSPPIRRNQEQ